MGNTSVSNRSSISESRKQIAGDFLTYAAEQYARYTYGMRRSVRLAVEYGWTLHEIAEHTGIPARELIGFGGADE